MRKIQALSALAFLSVFSVHALAGANTAQLNCKGVRAGHQIVLAGSIPATIAEVDLELSYHGQAIRLATPEAEASASTDFRHGIFNLEAAHPSQGKLQLQAHPKSVKYKGSINGGKLNASFDAVLTTAPEPFNSALQGAELSCSYAYEI